MKVKDFFKNHWPITLIVLLAAALRLYALDRGDPISDEVLYGFRAIGMLDFDFAVVQPTPYQLFNITVPWWVHLSFHDHPILVFLMQHWFMGLFGVNLWGLRLSSALFGITSVFLIALLGEKLFSRKTGIAAAALFAVNVLMLYVSRTGVQEAQVIFFMMLTVYCFLRAEKEPRWYLATGAALGLGLLSKYTIGFLVLPLGIAMLVWRRTDFKRWQLYAGALILLAFCSPFIIYNFMLYREFGHFDFQLFYIFGQKVSYWQSTPGKEIGSVGSRAAGIFGNLWAYHSNVLNVMAVAALLWCIARLARLKIITAELRRSLVFLLLLIASSVLLFLAIGPSPRFLSMLIPWLLLLIAAFFVASFETVTKPVFRLAFIVFFVALISWETFFSYNSYIAYQPVGTETIAYSRIHWDEHAWGFNRLDEMIGDVIKGKYPKYTIPYTYQFLEDVKTKSIQKAKAAGKQSAPYLFVYDDAQSDLATLWAVNRHSLYEGWPMIAADDFRQVVEEKGDGFYASQGFTDTYFIRATDKVLQNHANRITDAGLWAEEFFKTQKAEETSIRNHASDEAFRWYHFNTQ
ncbi:MAG: glycosyltransferase family 39 protein [Candidatus Komeilibacteria bacterium]|nr:glycosyltransferase family 39 protein [Candidatus Komeilibacteria bacterium]